MGLADFGLGPTGSPYSVYASDVLGSVQLNDYNATAGPLYEDTGAYYWDGTSAYANPTPWQSSIELNTVVTNVSYPGANNGSFWTQNVVDFQGSEIQLVDNIWNTSNSYGFLWPGTLYAYNGFLAYPEFYYDDGPTLPAAYPMSIQLYNNATNVDERSVVTFGYRVTEPDHVYTGIYDQVVFNSTPNASVPLLTPDYLVSGTNTTPLGLLYDAELTFGGPGSGSNAVITSLNGSEAIAYRTSAGWSPAPSAYDYGTDTGETSIGMAGWYSGAKEVVNQGPSMLYGLWNTSNGVPSGNIEVDLHLDPSYLFVFIGLDGTDLYNESYAPSTAAGTVQTWLPPGEYNFSAWADGFAPMLGQFSASLIGPLDLDPDAGVWNAPLYLNGPAQAQAFGTDATGWAGVGPILFLNLSVNVSLIFNHVNDYGYTEFALFWAFGISSPQLLVDNVTQGPDLDGQTLYITDEPGQVLDLPDLGDTLQAWDVAAPEFTNLSLIGVDLTGVEEGGAVAVWDAPGASASRVNSTDSSFGFWAANSPDVVDTDSNATSDGFAFSLMGSPHAEGTNLGASLLGYGVLAEGADGGSFQDLQALLYSVGFQAYESNDTQFTTVVAEIGSTGLDLQGTSDDRVVGLYANSSSLGVFGDLTNALSVTGLYVSTGAGEILSTGASLYATNWTNISDFSINNAVGADFLGGANASLTNVTATDYAEAVFLIETGTVTVENFTASNSLGLFIEYNLAPVTVNGVSAVSGGIGVATFLAQGVLCSDVVANGWYGSGPSTYGVIFADSNGSTATNVEAEFGAIGVNASDSSNTTVRNVSAYNGAAGTVVDSSTATRVTVGYAYEAAAVVVASKSSGLILSDLTADDAYGAVLAQTSSVRLTGVLATDRGTGVSGEDASYVSVTLADAQNESLGVAFADSSHLWINQTAATNWSIGVRLEHSTAVWISGVVAADPYATDPYSDTHFATPTAAVVTEESDQVTISSVRASDYPAGLYDDGSEGLVVNGLNASQGDFGVILNGTFGGLFYDLQTDADQVGLQLNHGASQNVVTESRFLNDVGLGVDIESGSSNQVYDNSFVGNNGAGAEYNASHIQAFSSSASNAFNSSVGVGNYWADWHTYLGGVLAPYFVGTADYDYHPLGAPLGMVVVTFTETGLPMGTAWSVSIGGSTLASTSPTIVALEAPGSYAYSSGELAGFQVTPAGGTVIAASGPVTIPITYAAVYPVTFVAYGFTGGSPWSVYLNGVAGTSSRSTIDFNVTGGTYDYTVIAPTGWTATDSSGSIAVGGTYTVPVTFTELTYAVTFTATGLVAGTVWSVDVNGQVYTTSTASITVMLPDGTVAYTYENVAGYSIDARVATGSVTVAGEPADVSGAYAPNATPNSTSGFGLDPGDAVALGLASVAVVVALAALLRPPRPAARPRSDSVPTEQGEAAPGAPRPADGDRGG